MTTGTTLPPRTDITRIAIWLAGVLLLVAYIGLGAVDLIGHALGHPLIATAVSGWAMTAIGSGGASLAAAAGAGWVVRMLAPRFRQFLTAVAVLRTELAEAEARQVAREAEWHLDVMARLTALEAERVARDAARDEQWARRLAVVITELDAVKAEIAGIKAERAERERAVFDAGFEAGQAVPSIKGRAQR